MLVALGMEDAMWVGLHDLHIFWWLLRDFGFKVVSILT